MRGRFFVNGGCVKAEALVWISGKTGLSEESLEQYVEAAVARLKAAGEELTKRGGSVVSK